MCGWSKDPRLRLVLRGLLADAVEFVLNCQGLEAVEREAEEQLDAAFESEEGIAKGTLDLFGGAGRGRRIGDAPVRGDGMAGPDGAGFVRSAIANSNDEVHRRSTRFGEFVPAFAAQACGGQIGGLELLDGVGVDAAGGMAAGAEGAEIGLAAVIQNGFGHDGARGVAGAEEENVVGRCGGGIHDFLLAKENARLRIA